MKRIITLVLLFALIFVFVHAKKMETFINPVQNTNKASFENPLKDFGTSYIKGKVLPKAMKNKDMLYLGYYKINVQEGEPKIREDLRKTESKSGEQYYIVQFNGPVMENYKDILKSNGVVFEWPINNYGFIVKMDYATRANISELSFINFISLYQPAYKVNPKWLDTKSTIENDIVLRLFKSADMNSTLERLNNLGIKVLEHSGENAGLQTVLVRITPDKLVDIANIDEVFVIAKKAKNYTRNDDGRAIVMEGTNVVADTIMWEKGIRGNGQTLNVTDSGVTVPHYAFYDASVSLTTWGHYPTHRKVVAYLVAIPGYEDTITFGDEAYQDYHGSHTSGTTTGNDEGYATAGYDGIAKDAQLFFIDCGNDVDDFLWLPADYYGLLDTIHANGVYISSNSWGDDGATEMRGAYSDYSQQEDAYVWDHKDMVLLYAAGNSGSAAQTISSDASAKNVVAVGSVTEVSPASISTFSSRGPTADGRYGVTILAPGEDVTSVDGGTSGTSSNYVSMQGTSMATPFAAGAVALIRDWLAQGFYPTGSAVAGNAIDNPSSALIRALMINSADDCGQTIPDTDYGWGRLQLNNVCFFNDADSPKAIGFVDNQDGLLNGEFIDYQFNISDNTVDLKVTLVWTDYPAPFIGDNTITDTTLVNDLDLVVTSPSGTEYTMNDHLNPMEQEVISNPETGVWTIRVLANNIQVSPQPFALVVTYGVGNATNGSITFDKAVYSTVDSIATITVIDNSDDITSPIDVTVYSMLGDTETVSCTGTTGKFVGQITLDYRLASNNDGYLAVTQSDTIYAEYTDVSASTVLKAMATTDGEYFTIYNVHTELVEGTRVKIAWNTTEVATGKVYYGTTTALGDETAEDPNLVTEHTGDFAIEIRNLSPNTMYYYDVESVDHKGNSVRDDNAGNHYSFATVDLSGTDILVVVTDDNLEGELFAHPEFLTQAIEDGGWSYAWWQTSINNYGVLPVEDLLNNYKAVFLQSGQENYPELTDNQEESLKVYEENGARIAYTGHDFGWGMASSEGFTYIGTDSQDSLFIIEYLMGQYTTDLTDQGDFTLYGVTGDPISGDYTAGVSYNPYRSGADGDLVIPIDNAFVNGTCDSVWHWDDGTNAGVVGTRWESSNTQGTLGVGVWGGYTTRVVYNAFEITQIDTSNATSTIRSDILNKDLIWLIGHDHPDITVSSPTGGTTYTSSPISIEWTATADASFGAYIDSVFIYYSPNGGDVWYEITKGTASEVTSPYSWDVTSLLNGSDYIVKVIVKDGGVEPAMKGFDITDKFTINIVGNDTEGPIVYAGSVQPSIDPVGDLDGGTPSNTFTLTAIVCDSTTGLSNIQAAEWSFGDTPAPAGSGNPMTAVDGAFDEMYEEVTATVTVDNTWPTGEVQIWVRGQDASTAKSANNWGVAESYTLTVLDVDGIANATTLAYFTATSKNNNVVLNWRTESEHDNAYFIVEKSLSKDGPFEKIATIKAQGSAVAGADYKYIDEDVNGGNEYYYRLTDVSISGTKISHPVIKVLANGRPRPTTFYIAQNYPNPFKDNTVIEYAIPVKAPVTLSVYDITGKLVKTLVNEVQNVNYYRVTWDGTDYKGSKVASGVYFYKLTSGDFEKSLKMTHIK